MATSSSSSMWRDVACVVVVNDVGRRGLRPRPRPCPHPHPPRPRPCPHPRPRCRRRLNPHGGAHIPPRGEGRGGVVDDMAVVVVVVVAVMVVVVPGVDDVAVVVLVVDPAWPNRGLSPRGHSPATTTTVGMVVVGKRGGGGKERVMLDHGCQHFWSHDLRIFPSHDIFIAQNVQRPTLRTEQNAKSWSQGHRQFFAWSPSESVGLPLDFHWTSCLVDSIGVWLDSGWTPVGLRSESIGLSTDFH